MEMREVRYLSDEQEEFVRVLFQAGLRQNDGRILVFLAGSPGATSRDIARGTDISQGALSLALVRLGKLGWITHTRGPGSNAYRNYSLAPAFGEFINGIESGIREECARYQQEIRKVKEGMK